MPVFEDAPFPLRRQSEPDCGLARFGLRGFEDSFNADGPLPPFWSVAPMLDVEPARAGGPGLAGLRLISTTLYLTRAASSTLRFSQATDLIAEGRLSSVWLYISAQPFGSVQWRIRSGR